MKSHTNWRIFLILLSLSLVSIICVFPYITTIQAETLANINQPIWLIFIAQFIQSAVLFSIAIFFGLIFTKKINFQLPLIEAIVKKENYNKTLNNTLGKSIFVGAITAVIIYLSDTLFTTQGATISTHQNYAPVWQKLLASTYGGITEEILMRLFLMTFLIWVGMKLFKQSKPTKTGIIVSVFLASIIFGLGHLPITASLTKLNPLIISRAIVLNGIGGVVFGWLFWKKGLESAMIAHFTADVFLLTLLPLLLK